MHHRPAAPGSLAPPVFGGPAVGVRARRGGGDDAAGAALGAAGPLAASADSQAARDAEMIWKRAGNSDCAIPST